MKKINLTPRGRRNLVAGGSVLVAVVAVITVFAFNTGAKVPEVSPPESSSLASTEISVGDIKVESGAEGGAASAFAPESGVSKSSSLTEISKPASEPPKPVIEGDASVASDGKVTPPTNPILTNKNEKPSYASTPTAKPASSMPTTPSKKPSSSSGKSNGGTISSKPSGGKPGQIYVPGFGWQYPTGGEVTDAPNVGDGWGQGSQVGIMD